jgi:hypothetical protein
MADGVETGILRRHVTRTTTGRHLLIGGPGRAGTSFLVRYLAELGLDTELARSGEVTWHAAANAGLETMPLRLDSPDLPAELPYVVKFPLLHECLDHVLSAQGFGVDGVIVPVRALDEAAASRVAQELQAVHRAAPWMAQLDRTWEVWAETPGGVVYSLNPVDQARLLAVGFYTLIERLVRAEIPLALLAFPRIVTDADYLFDHLRALLPTGIGREEARRAHARVADRGQVRIAKPAAAAAAAPRTPRQQDAAALDALALRRELTAVRRALTAAAAEGDAAAAARDRLAAEVARLEAEAATQAARHRADAAAAARQLAQAQAAAAALAAELRTLRASRAWRLTAPYRAVGRALVRLLRRDQRRETADGAAGTAPPPSQ